MEKKYQIFISSTYEDLKEERKKVQDTILSMYQFPIGMEMFSAANEEQWEIIRETIDSSDYYVLIIGHRYGSVIERGEYAGISYTQKEFRYALEKKIPVLAFLIDSSVAITLEKMEQDNDKREKLKEFIDEVKDGRTVQWWTSKDDLAKKVSIALTKEINRGKRPGWIRAEGNIEEKIYSSYFKEKATNNISLHDYESSKDKRSDILATNNKDINIIDMRTETEVIDTRGRDNDKKKIIVKFLMLLFVLFLGTVSFIKYQNITIADEVKVHRKTSELLLNDMYISNDTIQKLNKFKNLSDLTFKRCEFEDGVLSKLSLSLNRFSLIDCTNITNFNFIANMDDLNILIIENCGLTDDNFPILIQENLQEISLARNAKFTNLSILPLSNLTNLDFSQTSVNDLSPLTVGENLCNVVGNNTMVVDLTPLASLSKLQSIHFNNCAIKEITVEFMSIYMDSISLANNCLKDCSGFSNFTILTSINLSNNELTNVSWLEKSEKTLHTVILSDNPLRIEQISFLTNCKNIQNLYINNIQMNSLSIVKSMDKLETLQAVHCGLQDISALQGLCELKYVRLAQNEITDVSSLKVNNYGTVDLAYNNITNISNFSGYFGLLILFGNPIDINSNNFKQIDGRILILEYTQGLSKYINGFSENYVINCPHDQYVAMENAVGNKSINFITQNGAIEFLKEHNIDYY